jgi:hypothetical protein
LTTEARPGRRGFAVGTATENPWQCVCRLRPRLHHQPKRRGRGECGKQPKLCRPGSCERRNHEPRRHQQGTPVECERELCRQKGMSVYKDRMPADGTHLSGARRTSASDCRCRAVRDTTLVPWYPSVNAPRTGGAYDIHHRTTKILSRAQRRGGGMAAGGARAAAAVDAGQQASQGHGSPRLAGLGKA